MCNPFETPVRFLRARPRRALLADTLLWSWCWFCWALVVKTPWAVSRRLDALLPWTGVACSEGFRDFRANFARWR